MIPDADSERTIYKPTSAQIVVGTPGVTLNFIKKGFLKTDKLQIFVLDEADHVRGTRTHLHIHSHTHTHTHTHTNTHKHTHTHTQMIGYKDSKNDKLGQTVKEIRSLLKCHPQMLLFSATFSDEAFKFAQDIIRDKGRKSADGIARVSVVSPVKR